MRDYNDNNIHCLQMCQYYFRIIIGGKRQRLNVQYEKSRIRYNFLENIFIILLQNDFEMILK